MVFYGTDKPLDIDEGLDKDKLISIPPEVPEVVNEDTDSYGIRPNVVDSEELPWPGSQKVDQISHPEVQKPTTENQTSGAGCIRYDARGCLGGCLILIILLLSLNNEIESWKERILVVRRTRKNDNCNSVSNRAVNSSLSSFKNSSTSSFSLCINNKYVERRFRRDHCQSITSLNLDSAPSIRSS